MMRNIFERTRPGRLAALVGGAVLGASLAMTIPAGARPASASVEAGSTQAAGLVDELSSRRGHRGGKGGGYGSGYKGGGFGDRSFKSKSYGGRYTRGGYGDRSFYKTRGRYTGKHHVRRYFGPRYVGGSYGSRSFGPRGYQ